MMRVLISVILIALFSDSSFAQPAATKLSFEVADVEVSKPGDKPNVDFLPGGKLTLRYLTMKEMIAAAWDLKGEYVTGGQAWLNSEHYNIVAKALATTPEKGLKQMLQNLLIERFKLEVHLEKKPMSVFVMVVGKKGAKLKKSAAGEDEKPSCKLQTAQERKDGLILRTIGCKKMSMDELAEVLPSIAPAYIDRPVVNLTEITGQYDFSLEWAPQRVGRAAAAQVADAPPPELDGPTVFVALETQLGLRLEQKKHPMDAIVVDKVERVPTDN